MNVTALEFAIEIIAVTEAEVRPDEVLDLAQKIAEFLKEDEYKDVLVERRHPYDTDGTTVRDDADYVRPATTWDGKGPNGSAPY